MTTWFISDLHLDLQRPAAQTDLLAFLQALKTDLPADALYILGDLFEYWIGDDVLTTPLGQAVQPVVQSLAQLTRQGLPIYFQHGNRDFLIGQAFAQHTGVQLLAETHTLNLYGKPTVLLHGDTLCTDDKAYQAARLQLRSPQWQAQILAMSIPERLQLAQSLRQQSQTSMQDKAEHIMDVNQHTVEQVMREQQAVQLIHGHTHRPAIHTFSLAGQTVQRLVLGDWYHQASFLAVRPDGVDLTTTFK